MNPLPCIVVLYNPAIDMCIWQKQTDNTIEKTKGGKGKGFFVKVPLSQVFLDDKSNKKLIFLFKSTRTYFELQFLAISKRVHANHSRLG